MDDLVLGQIVQSGAGRDKDNWMIVVGILNDNYVLLSNGTTKKINSPKKKNIKHVKKTNTIINSIRDKLENNQKVENTEIKCFLKEYRESRQRSSDVGPARKNLSKDN